MAISWNDPSVDAVVAAELAERADAADESGEEAGGCGCFRRNRFFDTTEIGGLGLIGNSKNRAEVAVWYALLCIFAVVAVVDLSKLVSQWLSAETLVNLSMNFTRVTQLPDSSVCIYAEMADFHMSFDGGFLHYDRAAVYPWSALLDAELRRLDTKQRFLADDWAYVLLPLANRYFAFVTYSAMPEMADVGVVDYVSRDDERNDAFFEPTFDVSRSLGPATMRFVEHARRLQVNDMELSAKLGRELIGLFGLHLVEGGRDFGSIARSERNDLIGRLTYVSGERFCFHVAAESFRSRESLFDIRLNMTLMRLFFTDPTLFDVASNESLTARRQLADEAMSRTALRWFVNDHNIFYPADGPVDEEVPFHTWQSGIARIVARYELLKGCAAAAAAARRARRFSCVTDSTPWQCRNDCRVDLIADRCGCLATTLEKKLEGHRHSSLPQCTGERYLECLKYEVSEDHACREVCLPACVTVQYEMTNFERAPDDWVEMDAPNSIHIQKAFLLTTFPSFVERPASTWQNFLGDIGGVLDFWLGASLLGIIHLFFFCGKQIGHTFERDHKTGRRTRKVLRKAVINPVAMVRVKSSVAGQRPAWSTDGSSVRKPTVAAVAPNWTERPGALHVEERLNEMELKLNDAMARMHESLDSAGHADAAADDTRLQQATDTKSEQTGNSADSQSLVGAGVPNNESLPAQPMPTAVEIEPDHVAATESDYDADAAVAPVVTTPSPPPRKHWASAPPDSDQLIATSQD